LPLVRLGAVLLLVALTPAARAQSSVDPANAASPAAVAPEAPPVAPPAVVAPAPVYAPMAPTPAAPALAQAPDVEKPARVPLAKRWWFWTSIGGAAVAVVLIGLLVRPPTPYSGNANPGLVQVF
jgi:hypothetical protein